MQEKIGTRLHLAETELKFAWRALDLLSGEFGRMWRRLEQLERLQGEQRHVVTNLMRLCGNQVQAHDLVNIFILILLVLRFFYNFVQFLGHYGLRVGYCPYW